MRSNFLNRPGGTREFYFMEIEHTYILVDPNDETGNDDGIIDEVRMTENQAEIKNNNLWIEKSDRRWIRKYPKS